MIKKWKFSCKLILPSKIYHSPILKRSLRSVFKYHSIEEHFGLSPAYFLYLQRSRCSCDRYLTCLSYALFSMHNTLCILFYAFHYIHYFICIVFYVFYSMHCISCIVFMHFISCIVFYALYFMHCILCFALFAL